MFWRSLNECPEAPFHGALLSTADNSARVRFDRFVAWRVMCCGVLACADAALLVVNSYVAAVPGGLVFAVRCRVTARGGNHDVASRWLGSCIGTT
jgi:hypothetical protein